MKTGVELIAEERKRQIEKEGWTKAHDELHDYGELANAALCYIMGSPDMTIQVNTDFVVVDAKKAIWPWSIKWWKPTPKDRVRELTKAGALIAAEIDRILNSKE